MATSAYFTVFLPGDLTEEQLVKIYEWGKNCLHCNMIQQDDGYLVIAHRSDEKDLKARQRLMLTNLKNWGIDAGKQKGWLKILTKDEFIFLNEQKGDARNSLPNSALRRRLRRHGRDQARTPTMLSQTESSARTPTPS